METVENMQGLRTFLTDDFDVTTSPMVVKNCHCAPDRYLSRGERSMPLLFSGARCWEQREGIFPRIRCVFSAVGMDWLTY
jgi:hypothetical protein